MVSLFMMKYKVSVVHYLSQWKWSKNTTFLLICVPIIHFRFQLMMRQDMAATWWRDIHTSTYQTWGCWRIVTKVSLPSILFESGLLSLDHSGQAEVTETHKSLCFTYTPRNYVVFWLDQANVVPCPVFKCTYLCLLKTFFFNWKRKKA